MSSLSLKKDVLVELRGDELRAVAAAGTDTCVCLTGQYPTFAASCLCSGSCDYSNLC